MDHRTRLRVVWIDLRSGVAPCFVPASGNYSAYGREYQLAAGNSMPTLTGSPLQILSFGRPFFGPGAIRASFHAFNSPVTQFW